MERFYKVVPKRNRVESSSIPNDREILENRSSAQFNVNDVVSEEILKNRSSVQFNVNDVVYDPGLRKPIKEFDKSIRDQIRREYIVRGPCQLIGHKYPQRQFSNQRRSFKDEWYSEFPWLEYSLSKDAAFCFWCYLFPPKHTRGKGANIDDAGFVGKGFTNWKSATERMRIHVGIVGSCHNQARESVRFFKDQRHNLINVLQAHDSSSDASYRTHVTAMLDVMRYLLKQGLPFRGHDESSSSVNKGNFLELVDWYCEKNEVVDNVCRHNAPGNNQKTSPLIQREFAQACAEEITLSIITDLGDSVFSLMVDESRDVSTKEQMGVVFRYVNKKGDIIERFIAIIHVPDTCAISLRDSIVALFVKHGLSISKLRGQGYDGASNMRGEFHGLQALIQEENPQAMYIHCFCHQLQLVIVSVAKEISPVADFFSYVTMIVTLAGASCKRMDTLREYNRSRIVKALEEGEITSGPGLNQETGLARPGDTRWGSHYLTLLHLHMMWSSVIQVLGDVHDHAKTSDNRGTSRSLIDRMDSYQFVFVLHLMKYLLGVTNELSIALQKKDQNIVNAMNLIACVKDQLQSFRQDGWEMILNEVNKFCVLHMITILDMDDNMTSRGYGRRRGQVITNYHHYHVDVFLQVVDLIIQEMNNRFSEASTMLLSRIACLDPRNSFSMFNVSELVHLASMYPEDFSHTDHLFLESQLRTYIHAMHRDPRFSNIENLGKLALKLVEMDCHRIFPLIYRLIELALVLPVATATVERVFSAMKIVKTDLRNRMGDELMNDCLVVYIEKRIFEIIDNESILQRFQNMKTRRYKLSKLPPRS